MLRNNFLSDNFVYEINLSPSFNMNVLLIKLIIKVCFWFKSNSSGICFWSLNLSQEKSHFQYQGGFRNDIKFVMLINISILKIFALLNLEELTIMHTQCIHFWSDFTQNTLINLKGGCHYFKKHRCSWFSLVDNTTSKISFFKEVRIKSLIMTVV